MIKALFNVFNVFNIIFFTTYKTCCNKQSIKIVIYKLFGDRISTEHSNVLYVGSVIMNLIGTYIIVRTQFVTFLLYIFFRCKKN